MMKKTIAVIIALIMLTLIAPSALADEFSEYKKAGALYTAKTTINTSLYDDIICDPDTSKRNVSLGVGATIYVYDVQPNYVVASRSGVFGYILRRRIGSVKTIDPVNTKPYAADPQEYIAKLAVDSPLYAEKDESSEVLRQLSKGTKITIDHIEDGWVALPYIRQFAYLPISVIDELIPVAVDVTPSYPEMPIGAYISFFKDSDNWENVNRMFNLKHGAEMLSVTIQSGEKYDFNDRFGSPSFRANGFQPAPILSSKATNGYGGGTCQVSSTTYNVCLQLPGIGILYRRAHGGNCATYLPHGADAAIGSEALNFIFCNNYDFPIRIEATTQSSVLFIAFYRAD
ncbi:MAG: VanW family protein [Eubacteriales bacterium]|nr:VanW family protein [Eubacteriales bacterium]MDD3881425.1 VanW family protein [Eubacteriales bacterium]